MMFTMTDIVDIVESDQEDIDFYLTLCSRFQEEPIKDEFGNIDPHGEHSYQLKEKLFQEFEKNQ